MRLFVLSAFRNYIICVIITFIVLNYYSHCVVALSLYRYVGFPPEIKMHVILSDISVLAQSNYTDGRSSTALFSMLVDNITS